MKNGLRDLRKARGLNQADLADSLEISRQTVIAIEANKYDPSLPMAYRMAAFFGVPVEELFPNPWKPGGHKARPAPDPFEAAPDPG